MNFIFSLLGLRREPPRPKCPVRVLDDDVVPLPFFDDQDLYRKMFLSFTFQFDSVLDPEKLRDSLSSLIARPGWRKLGGRVRLEPDGRLYLHVPQKFTSERPAVGYAHQHYDCSIREHSVASGIPAFRRDALSKNQPSMLTSTAKFQSLAVRPEGPTSIADLLNSDEPQISLYVVTFLGATLVSISWSHCTMDGTAFSNLLTSWSAILNDGKPMEAFPELEDPVKDLGLKETPDHPLKGALLPFWSALAFVFRSVMDRLSDPGVESRTFFFPGEWVSDLRKQCLDDIIAAGLNAKIGSDSSSSNSKSPFISTNDVLLPYITKNYTTVNLAPKRPVAILSLADIRCRMPSAFSESMAYLSNLLILSPTFTTPEELSSHPLGLQAAKVREALVAQMSDEETVEGTLYMGRRMHEMLPLQKKAPYKTAIVLGSSDTFRTVVTNWDRMSFYDAVDFRSAVVDGCAEDGKEGGKRNEKGKPVHYFADTLSGGNNPWRHSWVIFGKDPEGDYWASGWLPRKTWETVEKDIRQGRLDTILGEL